MRDQIRILILEDVADDVVRINHELRQSGMHFRSKSVDSKQAFLFELEHHPPEVILSDHGLPSFDGFTALAIARDKCPDVPFIFVTGSLGEQMTIEMFKSGATDYVLKNRLGDLAPAVERALREARERGKHRETQSALESLRRSHEQCEAQQRFILEAATDAIILIDPEGKILEWNPAARKIFGYSRDQSLGQSPVNLIAPPRVLELYRDGLTYYLMTGSACLLAQPIELAFRRADGSEFRAEMSVSRNDGRQPPHYAAIVRDTTERRKAEAALRECEERHRIMVKEVKDYAIYTLDPEGRVATWNTGAERVKGYAATEVLGQPFTIFFTPVDVAAGVPGQLLTRAEREGQSVYDGPRVRKDGSHCWIQGLVTALRDAEGRLRGFTNVAHDITRQKAAEEQIRQLNEQLEQRVSERTAQLAAANQEMEAFSYSISHDLRAPLLRISGFANILDKEAATKLDERHKKYLQTIVAGAQQMSQLIDALLDFSRTGRAELRQVAVSMAALVEEAQHELRREGEGRDLVWRIGHLPDTRGDPVMLRQVVLNLLSNALKYTRPRKPAVIELGAKTAGGETVYFIRDNGVGFDMEYVGKLFGVFQRLHAVREFEGTGIGLANVQRIVGRHGGRVWAESVLDQGATFYFSIPNPNKNGI